MLTTTQRIRNILAMLPDTRNSDTELQIVFMQKSGMNLSEQQIALFKRMPKLETIRRVRQKIQESGEYEADPKIKKERAHKAMVMQQTTPTFNEQQIEQTLNIKVLPWGKG